MIMPPFCPNPHCSYHSPDTRTVKKHRAWYIKSGFYTPAITKTPVQRFLCKSCGQRFSENTFHLNYYAKRHLSYIQIMRFLSSGMSLRAIARFYTCSPNTINRKLGILSRQIAVLMTCVVSEIPVKEDFAADGFESFAVSQYFPNTFNLLVGKDSQFVYHVTYIQLHRKGSMTAYQKKTAQTMKSLWPLPADQERLGFLEITRKIVQILLYSDLRETCEVFTDEKPLYRRCLSERMIVPGYRTKTPVLIHRRIPSTRHRDVRNDLFPVNYMDREIRKDLAEHHRETTCFARNVNSCVARMNVYLLYHNFFKPFRINRSDVGLYHHADMAGIERKRYRSMLAHLFTRRLFFSHYRLSGHYEKVWRRAYQTPLKWKMDYVPAYAFA